MLGSAGSEIDACSGRSAPYAAPHPEPKRPSAPNSTPSGNAKPPPQRACPVRKSRCLPSAQKWVSLDRSQRQQTPLQRGVAPLQRGVSTHRTRHSVEPRPYSVESAPADPATAWCRASPAWGQHQQTPLRRGVARLERSRPPGRLPCGHEQIGHRSARCVPAMAGPMAFGPAHRFVARRAAIFRGTAARGSPSGGHRPRDLMHSHADGCRLGAGRAKVGRLWRSLFADGLDALAGRVHEVVGDLVGLSGRPVDLPGVVPQGLHP